MPISESNRLLSRPSPHPAPRSAREARIYEKWRRARDACRRIAVSPVHANTAVPIAAIFPDHLIEFRHEEPSRSELVDHIRDVLAGLHVEAEKYRRAATLEQVRYGRVHYRLRRPLVGEFRDFGGAVEFHVNDFVSIIGRAIDHQEAVHDFQRRVHVRLQSLLAKFDGAWTNEDRRDWEVLQAYIDLDSYLRDRSIETHKRGEVLEAEGDFWRVRWLDGETEEVDLRELPDDFAAFEPGDHFEAFVSVDPATNRLAHMYTAHPVEPPVASDSEAWNKAVDSATPARLPESTIDWTS